MKTNELETREIQRVNSPSNGQNVVVVFNCVFPQSAIGHTFERKIESGEDERRVVGGGGGRRK